MKKLALGIALAIACTAPVAAFKTAGDLYKNCVSEESIERIGCIYYILGAVDMGNGVLFCMPPDATGGDARDIFVAFVKRVPEAKMFGADIVVTKAVKDQYPCKKQKKEM